MTPSILVVGSLNMDLVVRVPRHPQPGETILGEDFATFAGGKGANQAVAAARLGGHVAMIGRVGDDRFGAALQQSLQAAGVETSGVIVDQAAPSGVALIKVDQAGQNTIVVAAGANGKLSPADLRRATSAFRQARYVLLQLESPLETIVEASWLAQQNGAQVLLNPAPAQALTAELLGSINILIPNETELALLAPEANSTAERAAALLAMGVGHVLVTLGAAGAHLFGPDGDEPIAPFRGPVVDTTAAGDAFIGGLAVGLSEGLSLREAARWGSAAGGLTVRRAGAQPALPSRAELLALLEE